MLTDKRKVLINLIKTNRERERERFFFVYISIRTVTQALTKRPNLIFHYLLIAHKFLDKMPRYCERKYGQIR